MISHSIALCVFMTICPNLSACNRTLHGAYLHHQDGHGAPQTQSIARAIAQEVGGIGAIDLQAIRDWDCQRAIATNAFPGMSLAPQYGRASGARSELATEGKAGKPEDDSGLPSLAMATEYANAQPSRCELIGN
jgi:hypothetical protein